MATWFRVNRPVRILTVLVGVLALVAALVPGWLAPTASAPVITPPPIASLDAGIRWTDSATPASALQRLAVDQLLGWLVVLGWSALAVGGVTGLALWATLAGQRIPEVAIRRAVGASRGSLVRAAIGEGLGIGAMVVGAAISLSIGAVRLAMATWPGTSAAPGFGAPLMALAAIGGLMVAGALFPLIAARSRGVTEQVETPPPLWIPATQLGVGLATLVGAAMIAGQVRRPLLAPSTAPATEPGALYQLEHDGVDVGARGRDYGRLLVAMHGGDPGAVASLTSPGGHEGIGPIDQLTTDCGQCYVGGIYLKWRPLRTTYHTASADTFRARGFPMIAGRGFAAADSLGATRVAVVNRYLAARYFESGQPLGREVFLAGRMTGPAYRVIGVVDDQDAGRGLGSGIGPLETIYLSSLQAPGRRTELLIVGTPLDGMAVPNAVTVVDRTTRAALARQRTAVVLWFGWLFGLEAAATLLLAAGGIAVLMAIWVSGSRIEFSIRRSVGATRWQIRSFVLTRALVVSGAGTGVGVVFFGPVLWPAIAQLVPGLSYWQPALVFGMAGGLAAITVLASVGPAWQAAKARPAELTSNR